jgi:hypothetical protein
MQRLLNINQQVVSSKTNRVGPVLSSQGNDYYEVVDNTSEMRTKLDYINPQGWGYKDSYFVVDEKKDMGKFVGTRYPIGEKYLPTFLDFA